MSRLPRRLLAVLAAAAALRAAPARAQEVVAVLSADAGPYRAAFEDFQKSLGRSVPVVRLPAGPMDAAPRARVVVAFGGEAALQSYPERAAVIACLAPGLRPRSEGGGTYAFVSMKPPADTLLRRLKALQPKLARLTVLWNAEDSASYAKALRRSGAALGVEVDAVLVTSPDRLPDVLRALAHKTDALWLAPDPGLVTPESFQTIKQFSWDSAIPFYAPTAGLVAAGAAAAVSVSAAEAGRQAAALARQALAGEPLPEVVYPSAVELTVNPGSAAKAGLTIAPTALEKADKVVQ